jgi:hypothetical protein
MRLVGCGSEITMLIERAQSMISELGISELGISARGINKPALD